MHTHRFTPRKMFLVALLPTLGMWGLTSCGEDQPAAPVVETPAYDPEGMGDASRTNTIKKIFYAAPSPMETAALVQRSGAKFDKKHLHAAAARTQYTTSDRQAVALGIYGADLSYATIFEENSVSLDYLTAIKDLSKSLGISDVLNDQVMAQAEANRGNREALIQLVSETFSSLNETLKENGMEDLSAMLVLGGWVEGVYLATQHIPQSPTELKARIAEQKLTLDDVMRLCRSYEATPELTALIAAMAPVEAAFAQVEVTSAEGFAEQSADGGFVVGGGDEIKASDATLAAITAAVKQVRGGMVK